MPFFLHRVFSYRPHKPRNPWLKVLLGVVGVVLLALLVVFGLVVGLGMLLFAATRRLLRPQAAATRAPSADVIEGEYAVVTKAPERLTVR
jgi:hypothetical protein